MSDRFDESIEIEPKLEAMKDEERMKAREVARKGLNLSTKDQKLLPRSGLIRIRSGDNQLHIVTRELLEKSSYFRSILSDRWDCLIPNKSNEIEICCASKSFTNLLNVLRYGQEAVLDLPLSEKYMLLVDASYFGFPHVLFNKINCPTQIARPVLPLPPVKIKAPRYFGTNLHSKEVKRDPIYNNMTSQKDNGPS